MTADIESRFVKPPRYRILLFQVPVHFPVDRLIDQGEKVAGLDIKPFQMIDELGFRPVSDCDPVKYISMRPVRRATWQLNMIRKIIRFSGR